MGALAISPVSPDSLCTAPVVFVAVKLHVSEDTILAPELDSQYAAMRIHRASGGCRAVACSKLCAGIRKLMQDPALAQDWPQRPLHIIVAFGPGGTTDVVARIIGQGLQERLRQSVVIENRAGAGGTLATMWWHAQKRMATRWAS
jgi:hypothetical protein